MQLLFDFENLYDYPPEAAVYVWLKRYRWTMIFGADLYPDKIDRRLARDRRIVERFFPNGISQAYFMKVKRSQHDRRYQGV